MQDFLKCVWGGGGSNLGLLYAQKSFGPNVKKPGPTDQQICTRFIIGYSPWQYNPFLHGL